MSEGENEQAARSLALEQAYVHEVYEQCADRTVQGRQWPRIYQFLQELEPGALVCDIGCGNGKYLNVNHNVFKIGVDRCQRFTNIARGKKNEVLTCDNLSMPFRDESFDAVLSIAVVHHFSTTERRVRAIKELARVLRIGGRLIISVWAMEQKHRKFESQDVLVPWPKAYGITSTGSPMRVRGMSCEERSRGKSAHQAYLMSKRASSSSRGSNNNPRKGSKSKSYWIDPIFSPSPSTSSLSSPNETCYSFFRRALQKLAGGRRNSRAWFLENWQNSGSKEHHSYEDDEDDADVDDLPIELRRLEEHSSLPPLDNPSGGGARDNELRKQHSDTLSVKSKSLSSIVEAQQQQQHGLDLVRSRSSIPGLCGAVDPDSPAASTAPVEDVTTGGTQHQQLQRQESGRQSPATKPKLVKQKRHLLEDNGHEVGKEEAATNDTAVNDITSQGEVAGLQVEEEEEEGVFSGIGKRGSVHKQSSMNEELMMSTERLRERESVRRNIMKQASLNEEFLYRSATKRFQLLKSGLTNRIRQSTNNIEKVSGMAIKNGFVRILQSWKSTESPSASTTTATTTTSDQRNHHHHYNSSSSRCSQSSSSSSSQASSSKRSYGDDQQQPSIERRLSREDGSDSSKDSSLQSDTSVDSEDSLPSVIYNPKSSSPQLEAALAGATLAVQLTTASAPPSPRIKYAPEAVDGHNSRLKLVSTSPLLKQQFPATSKSLPPPSPPGLSPHTLKTANLRPFFSGHEVLPATTTPLPFTERLAEVKRSFDAQLPLPGIPAYDGSTDSRGTKDGGASSQKTPATVSSRQLSEALPEPKRPSLHTIRGYRSMSTTVNEEEDDDFEEEPSSEDTSPLITDAIDEALERLSEKPVLNTAVATTPKEDREEDSRKSRLNQIKELLSQKPGFATRARSTAFPIVRRASTSSSGRLEQVTKALPRLLSLELFNPETDDLDSDSSGVSSPESAGSVISVISDERYLAAASKDQTKKQPAEELPSTSVAGGPSPSSTVVETKSARPVSLDTRISPVESTWNEECSRQLNDLTDRLSGNLIRDIDQYCRRTKLDLDDDDPNNLAYPRGRTCKYDKQPESTVHQSTRDLDSKDRGAEDDGVVVDEGRGSSLATIQRSCSEESDNSSGSGFIVVTKNGEFLSERELRQQTSQHRHATGSGNNSNSIESSDIGDSIENTISESVSSQETRRLCSSSTASLASSLTTDAAGTRLRLAAQPRSASEEIPSSAARSGNNGIAFLLHQQRQHQQQTLGGFNRRGHQGSRRSATSTSNGTLSGSSSQESLPSDQMTYHQYYHVFREGELDQLIDKYVENLHIISSYYDQSSWCIVAEKVQVWTI
ncbi:uncharacterized protein LOC106641239 [Copidosoma floridanum]|uniref:uncharacterized protein LOC106641239 n=1 Tax=Copidosoma floridanum TaxID=29053 RepID=UPI000C6F6A13|nr:uncharacterized protein LOC106641239 [Copidosoma floridanum]